MPKTKKPCPESAPERAVLTDYGVVKGVLYAYGPSMFKVERYQRYEGGRCTHITDTVATFQSEEHALQYAARMRGEC